MLLMPRDLICWIEACRLTGVLAAAHRTHQPKPFDSQTVQKTINPEVVKEMMSEHERENKPPPFSLKPNNRRLPIQSSFPKSRCQQRCSESAGAGGFQPAPNLLRRKFFNHLVNVLCEIIEAKFSVKLGGSAHRRLSPGNIVLTMLEVSEG